MKFALVVSMFLLDAVAAVTSKASKGERSKMDRSDDLFEFGRLTAKKKSDKKKGDLAPIKRVRGKDHGVIKKKGRSSGFLHISKAAKKTPLVGEEMLIDAYSFASMSYGNGVAGSMPLASMSFLFILDMPDPVDSSVPTSSPAKPIFVSNDFTVRLPTAAPNLSPESSESASHDLARVVIEYLNQCAEAKIDKDTCLVSKAIDSFIGIGGNMNNDSDIDDEFPSTRRFLQGLKESNDCGSHKIDEQYLRFILNGSKQKCTDYGLFISEEEFESTVNKFLNIFHTDSCWAALCEKKHHSFSLRLYSTKLQNVHKLI